MASQTTVRNNLGSAPNGEMIGDGGTALVADFNLFSNAPGFVNAGARDFRLAPGSPAIDAGVALPHVLEDIQGTRRPVNGDGRLGAEQDLGANERVP
jgi:hypothetical protein